MICPCHAAVSDQSYNQLSNQPELSYTCITGLGGMI